MKAGCKHALRCLPALLLFHSLLQSKPKTKKTRTQLPIFYGCVRKTTWQAKKSVVSHFLISFQSLVMLHGTTQKNPQNAILLFTDHFFSSYMWSGNQMFLRHQRVEDAAKLRR